MMWRGGGACPFCGSAGGSGIGGLLALLFGLMVLAGVVLLAVWAFRQFSHNDQRRRPDYRDEELYAVRESGPGQRPARHYTPPPTDPAVAAARERYARGEIDRDELERILATLHEAR